MITTGALVHGDVPRHLDFDPAEHPVALQLGGSEPRRPRALRAAGRALGLRRDQPQLRLPVASACRAAAFGACLMAEPALVADCVKAMRTRSRCRSRSSTGIGLDRSEDYGFVRDFVETLARAGCRTFIVHARNAVLKGLSPKENREVPPLRYAEVVHRLEAEFPELDDRGERRRGDLDADRAELARVDGVMLGRAAYHDPYLLAHARPAAVRRRRRRRSRAEIVQRDAPLRRPRRSRAARRCARSRATCSASTTAGPAGGAGGRCFRTRRGSRRTIRNSSSTRSRRPRRGPRRLLHNRTAHERHDLRRQPELDRRGDRRDRSRLRAAAARRRAADRVPHARGRPAGDPDPARRRRRGRAAAPSRRRARAEGGRIRDRLLQRPRPALRARSDQAPGARDHGERHPHRADARSALRRDRDPAGIDPAAPALRSARWA